MKKTTGFVIMLGMVWTVQAWAAPKANTGPGGSYVPPANEAEASCRKRLLSVRGPSKDKRSPFSESEMAIIAVCMDIRYQDSVISCMASKIQEDDYYFKTPYRAWHYCETDAAKLRECIANPILKKHLKTTEKIYDACAAPQVLDIPKLIQALGEKGGWGLGPLGDCLPDGTRRVVPKPSPMPELDRLLNSSEGFQGPLAVENARAFQKIFPPSGMIGQCRVRLVVQQNANGGLIELKLGVQDPVSGKTKILLYTPTARDAHTHSDMPDFSQTSHKRMAQFRDWAPSDISQKQISRTANIHINSETGLAESMDVQDRRYSLGNGYLLEDSINCAN